MKNISVLLIIICLLTFNESIAQENNIESKYIYKKGDFNGIGKWYMGREIAYVMGQMQDSAAVPHLIDRLSDLEEDVMVRHEAAEALGAIGDKIAMSTLREFVDDDSIVVAESCEVAIDLLDYVSSKRLDYS